MPTRRVVLEAEFEEDEVLRGTNFFYCVPEDEPIATLAGKNSRWRIVEDYFVPECKCCGMEIDVPEFCSRACAERGDSGE